MNARSEYLENSVRGASPLGLIVKLYEQLVEDLRRAIAALDGNQIDQRTNAINHALLIIGQLQGRLNHEAGAGVANDLDHFYNVIRDKLFQAQVAQSKPMLSEVMSALLEVRGAWQEADRAQSRTAAPPEPRPPQNLAAEAKAPRLDWKV